MNSQINLKRATMEERPMVSEKGNFTEKVVPSRVSHQLGRQTRNQKGGERFDMVAKEKRKRAAVLSLLIAGYPAKRAELEKKKSGGRS